MTHFVYHLVDPETRAVCYVGKSRRPKARLCAHIKESLEQQNTEKKRWIAGLLNTDMRPVLIIVAEYADEQEARKRESAEARAHIKTTTNIHDPAKGAKDLKRPAKSENGKLHKRSTTHG